MKGVVYECVRAVVVRQALDLHEKATNQPVKAALQVREKFFW